MFNLLVKLMLSHSLRHNTFNKLTFCSLKSKYILCWNVFKFDISQWMSTLFLGIQHICPRYIFSFIAVYAQIYIYLVAILLAVKARFCMFLFLDFDKKGNLNYAFKRQLLSCMTWLECSYLWYMVFKVYSLSSVCSDLAPQFCLVQVIILVFVNKIFDIFVVVTTFW